LNSIIYQSLNSHAKKKLWLAFRTVFQDARWFPNNLVAFFYLESHLSAAFKDARKDRDKADRAMTADMDQGADERTVEKNEMYVTSL